MSGMGDKCGFEFIKENCIQCHGCETACKSWRSLAPGVRFRRVENIWQGEYPNVNCSSLSIACLHCDEPACVYACPSSAISKNPVNGLVTVDKTECTGCGACFEACPYKVPQFGEDGKMQKCDMCVNEKLEGAEQPCIATCPTKALRSRSGKAKVILLVLMAFVMLLVAGFLIYAADYSHADETAIKVTVSDNTTTVSMYGHNMVFEPANGEIKAGFIFYPGGKVEYTAYAPLMKRISEQGYLCVLVHMPLNLAVFDKSAAGSVLEQFGKDGPAGKNIEKWYIGGHSLGGAMAASYAADKKDLLEGLVLLAAYPTSDLSNSGLKVLSMYGSEDGVLNAESYSNGRKYMPEGFTEISIDGGNHAGFGNYGAQKGDGAASISAEKQQENAAAAIVSLMN